MRLPEGTDEQILARYADEQLDRSDREAAFRELVARYRRRIYGICYRYFGDHDEAEEATQETFVLLVRRAGQFRGEAKLSTWIYRIAVNACHDLARHDARRPRTPVADVAALDRPADSDAPSEIAAGHELAGRLQRALLQLDGTSRACVILGAVEGRPYAEVATILDMPVGTVKSRIHRARATLTELLEADENHSSAPAPGARLQPGTPPGRPTRGETGDRPTP